MELKLKILQKDVCPRCIQMMISVLIIYEGWYIEKFGPIPMLLQILSGFIFTLTVCKYFYRVKSHIFRKTFGFWLAYGLFSVFGLILSENMIYGFEMLTIYFSFLLILLCTGIINDVLEKNNSKWLDYTVVLVAFLCAISVFFSGYDYVNGLYVVKTMSANNNPNTLSFVMAMGIYYLLLRNKTKAEYLWYSCFVLSLFFFYIILNTGSRSGMICSGLIIVMAIIQKYCSKQGTIREQIISKLFLTVFIGVLFFLTANYIVQNGFTNGGILRIVERLNGNSVNSRGELYSAAWDIFINNPIIGIGYDCFAVSAEFGHYTHSTYMELLACTGVIGCILFMYPVFRSFIISLKHIKLDNGALLVLLVVYMVDGLFAIWFYDLIALVILYINIYKENIEENLNGRVK